MIITNKDRSVFLPYSEEMLLWCQMSYPHSKYEAVLVKELQNV